MIRVNAAIYTALAVGIGWPASGGTDPVSPSNQPAAFASTTGDLARSECWLTVLDSVHAECFTFTVPEDYKSPAGPKVVTRVAVLRGPKREVKPDAVLILHGGPGYSGAAFPNRLLEFANGFGGRDIVIPEPRGYSYSSRPLTCADYDSAANKAFAASDHQEAIAILREYWRDCYSRVSGIADLKFYNDQEVVRDNEALRAALGISEWNLYGGSAGGASVYNYARLAPTSVRSAIADSPSTTSYIGRDNYPRGYTYAARAWLAGLLQRCLRDQGCKAAFPRLIDNFEVAKRNLDQQPFTLSVSDPATGNKKAVHISAAEWEWYLHEVAHQDVAIVPLLIDEIARGEYRQLEDWARSWKSPPDGPPEHFALGFHQNSICSAWRPGSVSAEIFEDVLMSDPMMIYYYPSYSHCSYWPLKSSSLEYDPIAPEISDRPILTMHGQLDPDTTYDMALWSANLSTRGQFVSTKNDPHIMRSKCAHEIMEAFLDNPSREVSDVCDREPDRVKWKLDREKVSATSASNPIS